MPESSHDQFRRSVFERYRFLVAAIDKYLVTANGDENQKRSAAHNIASCAQSFLAILAASDRPTWATRILEAAEGAEQSHGGNINLTKTIVEIHHKIKEPLLDEVGFDSFDDSFARLRDAYAIPELFNKMVMQLEQILANNEIDHASAIDAIQKLIAVLKRNKEGSFAAIRGSAWLAIYVKNLLLRLVSIAPGIQQAVEAYRDTTAEFQKKLDDLQRDFTADVVASVHLNTSRLEKLTGQSTAELVEVTQSMPRIEQH